MASRIKNAGSSSNGERLFNSFYLFDTSVAEVTDIIKNLKKRAAGGIDAISVKVLQEL